MDRKFYRAAWGVRSLIQMAPALVLALIWLALWIWGDRGQFATTGAIVGLMMVFWLGTSLWRVLSEGYSLEEGCLVLVSGPQRTRVAYGTIVRVMTGDVTLPESRMARGALLIEQQGAARGHLLYPRELEDLVAQLKKRAPGAIYITNELELRQHRNAEK